MAEAVTLSPDGPPAKKPGLLKRILLPFILLLLGIGGGAAGAWLLPAYLPSAQPPRPPAPHVAPLEYVPIDNSFTANLKDSGRFIQVKIAISTNGGSPVVEAVERHKVPIIAAVLGVLADTKETDLELPGGRDKLATSMRIVINDVLQRKSGVAGVDEVFITSFVLQ